MSTDNQNSDKSLNLITINEDCKEFIFEYLEWADLISVADTSKQLYTSVCRVFNRKYGGNSARIDIGLPVCSIFDEKQITEPLQPEPVICVTRPELAFKLLRNFGHLILNLNLEYIQFNYQGNMNSIKGHTMIEDYLAEYCSETLCQLSLQYFDISHRFDKSFFHDVQKQFPRVKTLHIINCNSYNDLSLNIIFPSLETFKWEYSWCFFKSTLITHLPTVKSVEIVFESYLKDEDVEEFFKLNHQLENAKIYLTGNHTDLYPRLKFYCPNIKNCTGFNLDRGPFYLYIFTDRARYYHDKNEMYPFYTSERYKNDLEALYFLYKKNMK